MDIRVKFGNPPQILTLELEEYLKGVLPSEMNEAWPMEALKAQAVTARTYVITRLRPNEPFDVVAGTQHQVFKPVKPPRSSAAVEATRGMILEFNGKPAQTLFFSSSVGHTESNAVVFGTAEVAYLRGVACPGIPEDMSNEGELRAFLITNPPHAFDNLPGNRLIRWTVTLPRTELNRRIARPEAIKVLGGQRVGTLIGLNVLQRGRSGMVKELEVIGSTATVHLRTAHAVRTLLSPDNFIVRASNPDIASSLFVMDPAAGGAIRFTGGGWGHCLGMSQWGAHGMAVSEHTFEDILAFYYPGTSLVTRHL